MRLVIFFVLFAFSFNSFSQKVKIVECDIFYKLSIENENALIIDIREKEEYKISRLQDALWAGTKESFTPILKDLSKDTPLLVYCSIGKRSKQCSKWLKTLGYKKVYELKGGIKEWIQNGYPVDSTLINE